MFARTSIRTVIPIYQMILIAHDNKYSLFENEAFFWRNEVLAFTYSTVTLKLFLISNETPKGYCHKTCGGTLLILDHSIHKHPLFLNINAILIGIIDVIPCCKTKLGSKVFGFHC